DVDRRRCGALYVQMIVEHRRTRGREAERVQRGSVEVDRLVRTWKTFVGRAHQKGSCLVAETVYRRDWRLGRVLRLQSSPRRPTTYGYPGCHDQQCNADIHERSS